MALFIGLFMASAEGPLHCLRRVLATQARVALGLAQKPDLETYFR